MLSRLAHPGTLSSVVRRGSVPLRTSTLLVRSLLINESSSAFRSLSTLPTFSRVVDRYAAVVETLWDRILYARGNTRGAASRLRKGAQQKKEREERASTGASGNRSDRDHESSSSSNGEGKEKPDQDPREVLLARMKRIFAISLFAYGILYMLSPNSDNQAGVVPTTWTEFTDKLLPTGQIQKIVVFPEKDRAFVYMYGGARSLQGEELSYIYSLGIPSLPRFEAEVRAAEAALNLPPEHWTQIQFRRMEAVSQWITLGLIGALMIGGWFLFKRAKISFNMSDMMSSMTKTKYNIIDPHSVEGKTKLKIKFKDVAGCHEAKVEINEFVDYLKNPNKYMKLGAKLPKGALLTGPPGCGKTLLAKALAAESTAPFISMNGSEFVEVIGGLGASRIRGLFKEAKQRAPCIVYIDEIDAIGRKRSEGKGAGVGGSGEEEQTLNQLLVEMDGMDSAKGIIVLASTNRPDVLDKALLRPGRFDRHITIDLPTVSERKEMFELYLKKIKTNFASTDYSQRLAMMTPGFSGADIGNVVNEAAIKAASEQLKIVSVKELEYAMDRVIAGPEKRSRTLVVEERETVAYHEAGHALVGWMLEHTDALLKVTIIPRTSAALGFAQYSPRDKKLFDKDELFERMCMMLGGRAAENIKFGRITTGAEDDLKKVTRSAYAQIKLYGMNANIGPLSFPSDDERQAGLQRKPYSKQMQQTMDQESSFLVGKAYRATEEIIRKNVDKLEAIAQSLLKHEVLSYEDVKKLIGPPPFGDKQVVDVVDHVLPKEEKM